MRVCPLEHRADAWRHGSGIHDSAGSRPTATGLVTGAGYHGIIRRETFKRGRHGGGVRGTVGRHDATIPGKTATTAAPVIVAGIPAFVDRIVAVAVDGAAAMGKDAVAMGGEPVAMVFGIAAVGFVASDAIVWIPAFINGGVAVAVDGAAAMGKDAVAEVQGGMAMV